MTAARGGAQARHRGGILRGDEIVKDARAARRAHPGHVDRLSNPWARPAPMAAMPPP
jgi:hypothetical protein